MTTTQRDLADLLGVTRRTVSRWQSGDSAIGTSELQKLARAVHEVDPSLASEIAAEGGTTVHEMGLAVAKGPAGATAQALARPFPPVELLLDGVLHVGVQALTDSQNAPPLETVKAIVRATVARARGLGLTLEEIEEALSKPPPQGASRAPAPKR